MIALPEPLTALMAELGKLPGIGPRSAERLALFLVQSNAADVEQLAQTLVAARTLVQTCATCGALTARQPCAICQNPQRDGAVVCVVERPVDILMIEKSGSYRGHYHVLGGKIAPVQGVGPEDLRIQELEDRVTKTGVLEVILALGADVEGEATCFYLAKRLAGAGCQVTRLAHGLPVGSSLEFADELTLERALQGRQPMQIS